MNTTERLQQWAIEKIKQEYPEDVALLIAVSGHSVQGDGHGECFDYYIPCTDRAYGLAQDFIIDGIGYDLYPRTWERTQNTANLIDRNPQTIGNAKIVYARTPEDRARFEALRTQFFDNLQNPNFVYGKALEELNVAMDLYRTMVFEQTHYKVRMATGMIMSHLMLALCFLNHTYQTDMTQGQLSVLKTLPKLPEHFLDTYQSVQMHCTSEQLCEYCRQLIASTRQFISGHRPVEPAASMTTDYAGIAQWYEEVSLFWRRLRLYAEEGNASGVLEEACIIQQDLIMVCSLEFGLPEYDLLSAYDRCDLSAFAAFATALEHKLVEEIKSHGINIRRYDTVEDFLRKN